MAKSPQLTDYVRLIIELFDRFRQERSARAGAKLGRPFRYSEESFVIFFMLMQYRRIYASKSQWRWLHKHPEVVETLGWEQIPLCTTIGRRYKRLYELLQLFVLYIGQNRSGLAEQLDQSHLVEDKSLFKARGPVWHERMRKAGRIPPRLRNLDTDATWSRSAYHGWVYGYGLHMTCNQDAFPAMLQVETAAVSESQVLDQKEALILNQLRPQTVAADNAYTKAMRIRNWKRVGVLLLTPAHRWVHGRFARAYHRFIQSPDMVQHMRNRRTSVEPLFDLIAKVIGTHAQQKHLPVKSLDKVRSCLALATLSIQIAMIINAKWGLPHRNISDIATAFQ